MRALGAMAIQRIARHALKISRYRQCVIRLPPAVTQVLACGAVDYFAQNGHGFNFKKQVNFVISGINKRALCRRCAARAERRRLIPTKGKSTLFP